MLRFAPPRSRIPHSPRWPDAERPRARTAFSRRPALEALSVVIDAELLDGLEESVPTRELLLAGLLSHEFVQLRRYSDNGPPADAVRRSTAHSMGAVEGWLVVTGFESGPPRWGVLCAGEKSVLETAFLGDIPQAAARDSANDCYAEFGDTAAAEQRQRDVIAAQASEAIDADMFITERPYLYRTKLPVADGVLIATPLQALPVVGLYLRAQDQFIGWRDADRRFTAPLARGTFYSRAAIHLVPQGWPLLTALAEHGQASGDAQLPDLARAVFGRVEQALVARDSMYWALNRPQDKDSADEALTAFDLAMLTLMGAVDASAQIAQRLLAVPDGEPSWLNRAWRTRARKASTALDAVFNGSSHLHSVTILSELRNTIHTVPLGPLALASRSGKLKTVIKLPADAVTQLSSAMYNLGGPAAWGVDTRIRGLPHADPAQLLDALIPRITGMLDAVMGAMPIDSLTGVNPANRRPAPARLHPDMDVPSESLLWQLDL
jgi:hypothetical protein